MVAITGFRVKHGMTDIHRPLEVGLLSRHYYTELTCYYQLMCLILTVKGSLLPHERRPFSLSKSMYWKAKDGPLHLHYFPVVVYLQNVLSSFSLALNSLAVSCL